MEAVTYDEDLEEEYDVTEELDPTDFMEEITEEYDGALEMDIDGGSGGGEGGGEGGDLADHIEIEDPPETEEIQNDN